MILHFIHPRIQIYNYEKFIINTPFIRIDFTFSRSCVSPEGIPRRPRDHYPEGRPRPRKPRCKKHGKVVVCKMPRIPRKKCTIRRPCVPPGYYRPIPPRDPMPTLPSPPFVIGGQYHIKGILTISFFIVIINPYNIIL